VPSQVATKWCHRWRCHACHVDTGKYAGLVRCSEASWSLVKSVKTKVNPGI
jgi:hypothetical protein